MFADVSGFTALGEKMLQKHGVGGPEYLARHLNSYFSQMVKIIAGEGGDIFKFAGDAMIVLWPDVDSVDVRCRRAAQVRTFPARVGTTRGVQCCAPAQNRSPYRADVVP
jgi:class 3 adenylate cyclase